MAVPHDAQGRSHRTPLQHHHSEGQPPRQATPAGRRPITASSALSLVLRGYTGAQGCSPGRLLGVQRTRPWCLGTVSATTETVLFFGFLAFSGEPDPVHRKML